MRAKLGPWLILLIAYTLLDGAFGLYRVLPVFWYELQGPSMDGGLIHIYGLTPTDQRAVERLLIVSLSDIVAGPALLMWRRRWAVYLAMAQLIFYAVMVMIAGVDIISTHRGNGDYTDAFTDWIPTLLTAPQMLFGVITAAGWVAYLAAAPRVSQLYRGRAATQADGVAKGARPAAPEPGETSPDGQQISGYLSPAYRAGEPQPDAYVFPARSAEQHQIEQHHVVQRQVEQGEAEPVSAPRLATPEQDAELVARLVIRFLLFCLFIWALMIPAAIVAIRLAPLRALQVLAPFIYLPWPSDLSLGAAIGLASLMLLAILLLGLGRKWGKLRAALLCLWLLPLFCVLQWLAMRMAPGVLPFLLQAVPAPWFAAFGLAGWTAYLFEAPEVHRLYPGSRRYRDLVTDVDVF